MYTVAPEIYTYWHTLSLHDALPIYNNRPAIYGGGRPFAAIDVPAPFDLGKLQLLLALDIALGNAQRPQHVLVQHQLRVAAVDDRTDRSAEHTSELQSLMRISYAVFCLKKKNHNTTVIIKNDV